MKKNYEDLLLGNNLWCTGKIKESPDYFDKFTKQKPPFLFIGCSDSRMPIELITNSEPGEIFVHRNIANQVSLTDINTLAVLEFAIFTLKIEHIIIGGHYACGGIEAAYLDSAEGIVSNWIDPIRALIIDNIDELEKIKNYDAKLRRISELNVLEQVKNLFKINFIQKYIKMNPLSLRIHGWITDFSNGKINELSLTIYKWKKQGIIPSKY